MGRRREEGCSHDSFNPSLSQGFPTPPRGQLSPEEKASGASCSSSPAVVAMTRPEGPCPGHLDKGLSGGLTGWPGALTQTSAPGKAGLKTARNLGRWYGGLQTELIHVSSPVISAHWSIPSVAPSAPPHLPYLHLNAWSLSPPREGDGQEWGARVALWLPRSAGGESAGLPLTGTTGQRPLAQAAQDSSLLRLVRGRAVAVSVSPEV